MDDRIRRLRELGPEPGAREITPLALYRRRRAFIAGAAGLGFGIRWGRGHAGPAKSGALPNVRPSSLSTTGESQTTWEDATSYNNFYEFGTGKEDPAARAHSLKTRPWTLVCEGEIKKPQRLDVDALLKQHTLEERVYRLRCVEAWSMVIPWIGFPLAALLHKLGPTSKARFVAFETLADPAQMPGQQRPVLDWPYTEGLRIDEAMHPLTILAVGMYGHVLPNQNGAPLRLVVPWKYGFKSIKSVVKIRLVETQPPTAWNRSNPREYGFYSNVNPEVDHPRWSQKKERRIGEFLRRKTLMFNGYGQQVAKLYGGMDLRKDF